MTKIYACLIGDWVCLNDDPNCVIGGHHQTPYYWWEEDAPIWSPITKEKEHTMYQQDYVNIHYHNKDFRIHPMFIQIVTE